LIRWPGKIKAGSISNDIIQTMTGCRRCSPPRATPTSGDKLKKGYQIGDVEYKVHIDGFNLLP